MKKYQLKTKILAKIALIFLILALLFALGFIGNFFELSQQAPFVRKRCPEFSSYAEIKESFDSGRRSLDRNHDSIPCNAQKP